MTKSIENAINKILNEEYNFSTNGIFHDCNNNVFISALKESLQNKTKINIINIDEDNVALLEFLEKFYHAISLIPNNEKNDLLKKLIISTDISVMSGDNFVPKILLNGGFVIRNYHRVIGLSEYPVLFKEFSDDFTYQDFVEKLEVSFSNTKKEDKEIHLSYINRTEEGVEWSIKTSESISNNGQALVIISHAVLEESDDETLIELNELTEHSRTGQVIGRVFDHGVYFFTTQRLSDSLDTLVEYFSHYLELDNNDVNIKQDFNELKKLVRHYSEDLTNEINEMDFLKSYPLVAENIKEHVIQNSTTARLEELSYFNSIFSESYDRPAGFEQREIGYYQFMDTVKPDQKLTVFQNDFKYIDADNFIESVRERIDLLMDHFNPIQVYVYFAPFEDPYDNKVCTDLTELNSEAFEEKLLSIYDFFNDEYENSPDDYESLQELLDQSEFIYAVLMITDEMILPKETHAFSIEFGEDFDEPFAFFIPAIGYTQEYWGTDIDEGNAILFFNAEE